MGGGNVEALAFYAYDRGLSPRGRGKPGVRAGFHHLAGSIPAWAGETVLNLR